VCEVPFGSYPGNMPYEYFSDEDHLREWLTVEEGEAAYRAFLETHLFGVQDFAEYVERCGGLKRMQVLRQQELLLERGR
jgi:glutaconate CoA-transferase subunit A